MTNKSIIIRLLCLFSLLPTLCLAEVFQREGELYPITEPDFREFIQQRLNFLQKTKALDDFKKEAVRRVRQSVIRPKSLELKLSRESYTHYVSSEFVVSRDIRLPSGQLIAAQGTTINPMDSVHFNGALIFFNADDQAQVAWVQKHRSDFSFVKLILTQGNIKTASKTFGRIYFDQEGRLTQKLKIRHVPAIATQEHRQWKISIIGEKEFAHA